MFWAAAVLATGLALYNDLFRREHFYPDVVYVSIVALLPIVIGAACTYRFSKSQLGKRAGSSRIAIPILILLVSLPFYGPAILGMSGGCMYGIFFFIVPVLLTVVIPLCFLVFWLMYQQEVPA